MKCLIIDDEPLALTQLEGYIDRIPFLTRTASCRNAIQASEVLAHSQVDLIFADINMPDMNGVDFIRSLVHPPMVIFTTAYTEYAIEGFRLNAIDYLTKPFGFAECLKAAEKARKIYEMNHNSPKEEEEGQTLFVKSEYKMVRIEKEKILYIEGMSEYVCIYLEDRPKPVITLNSLQKLSSLLPSHFMRVHRSYIVNLKKIREISRFRILFGKDVYIPVSENYREQFMEYIHSQGLL